MLTKAILKIEEQRKEFKEGSGNSGLADALLVVCRENESIAKAIATTDKTITDCAKVMLDYAKEHKEGQIYVMSPPVVKQLITKFYGVSDTEALGDTVAKEQTKTIDILALLD